MHVEITLARDHQVEGSLSQQGFDIWRGVWPHTHALWTHAILTDAVDKLVIVEKDHFFSAHKNLTTCCRVVAWTVLEQHCRSCVRSIIELTIILFSNDGTTRLFMAVGNFGKLGKFVLIEQHVHCFWYACYNKLVLSIFLSPVSTTTVG